LQKSSRSKSKLSIDDIQKINEVVSQGVLLGQSLHHIYISNPFLSKICVERTIRRIVYRGILSIKPHQLRRYVTYKHEYSKNPSQMRLRDIRVLIGRSYKDYKRKTTTNKRANIVQLDSLIGCRNDNKAILTITFARYNFQFGLLIDKGSPGDVLRKLRKVFNILGSNLVKEIFPIILADNGVEFSYLNQIEIDGNGEKITSTFFTNPYRSTDKAECERNHELVRYILPKSRSFNSLTQEMLDEAFSHINSYVRESKGNKTPYDLVRKRFSEEFLKLINIRRVDNKKVRLVSII
jgi:IS30 family transposase